ncbi:MAG: hypothetical protein ABI430_04535 [Candidatus Taylorbacteria bacterium]
MTDLGLYNYIKSELAQGKTKEQITATLMQGGGWTQADTDTAFSDIESNTMPNANLSQSEQSNQNNKAKIAFYIALITFLPWFILFGVPTTPYSLFYWLKILSIILFIPVGIIGIVFSVMGFRQHKIKALLAILFCLINFLPTVSLAFFTLRAVLNGNVALEKQAVETNVNNGGTVTQNIPIDFDMQKYFPLKEGNYWTYNQHIVTTDENNNVKNIDFVSTTKVVSSTATKDGYKVYKIERTSYKGFSVTQYYILVDNTIYVTSASTFTVTINKPVEDTTISDIVKNAPLIYDFPLTQGKGWKAFPDLSIEYPVAGVENVTVPAGNFDNSFRLEKINGVNKSTLWFFPTVGGVKSKTYNVDHDNSSEDISSELKEYKVN